MEDTRAELRQFEHERLTRRQLIQSLAFTATAASVASFPSPAEAQVADANANNKVRTTLEGLVRDTPEIGLQVAAYLNGKLVIDCWAGIAERDQEVGLWSFRCWPEADCSRRRR